jgi:hypothetical protein
MGSGTWKERGIVKSFFLHVQVPGLYPTLEVIRSHSVKHRHNPGDSLPIRKRSSCYDNPSLAWEEVKF